MKTKERRTKAEREADSRRTGRPPCVNPRCVYVGIRFTVAESAKARARARKAGEDLSSYIRRKTLEG